MQDFIFRVVEFPCSRSSIGGCHEQKLITASFFDCVESVGKLQIFAKHFKVKKGWGGQFSHKLPTEKGGVSKQPKSLLKGKLLAIQCGELELVQAQEADRGSRGGLYHILSPFWNLKAVLELFPLEPMMPLVQIQVTP